MYAGDNAFLDLDMHQVSKLQTQHLVVFVDVRTLDEWRRGHIQGAIHFPLAELLQTERCALGQHLGCNENTHYVVYCQHGIRSQHACHYLSQHQVKNLYNLRSGYADVIASTIFEY